MKLDSWLKLSLIIAVIGSVLVGCSRLHTVRDSRGNKIPGSLASDEKVYVNGVDQQIYIRGLKRANPVVLWLDNSPAMPEVRLVHKYLEPMYEDFTVVCWDQRGFGGSSRAAELRYAKVDTYVRDVISLSELLARRYNQKKIYLAGHDWGSVIGLRAAAQRPDLFAAFIGIAQRVNTSESDRQAYYTAIENAQRTGDLLISRKLQEQGPPPYNVNQTGRYPLLFSTVTNYAPTFYVGQPDYRDYLAPSISLNGSQDGYNYIYPQLADLDFETQLPSIQCPVFFVCGKYDYITPASITERYYKTLDAPLKDMVVFEQSGHAPCFSEPDRFAAYMTNTVLALTE